MKGRWKVEGGRLVVNFTRTVPARSIKGESNTYLVGSHEYLNVSMK